MLGQGGGELDGGDLPAGGAGQEAGKHGCVRRDLLGRLLLLGRAALRCGQPGVVHQPIHVVGPDGQEALAGRAAVQGVDGAGEGLGVRVQRPPGSGQVGRPVVRRPHRLDHQPHVLGEQVAEGALQLAPGSGELGGRQVLVGRDTVGQHIGDHEHVREAVALHRVRHVVTAGSKGIGLPEQVAVVRRHGAGDRTGRHRAPDDLTERRAEVPLGEGEGRAQSG